MNNLLLQLISIRIRGSFGGMIKSAGTETNKKKRAVKYVIITLLLAYCVVVFFGMFVALFYTICKPYCEMDIAWLYFSVAAALSFALCFISSVFTAQSMLYDSKDNELLLSMPIKSGYILAGRSIALLILSFIYESVIMLPAIVIWAVCGEFSLISFLGWLTLSITVPLISSALAAVVGGLFALATARIKTKKNVVTIVLSVAFLIAYFAFFNNASEYVQLLIANGEMIADAIQTGFYPLYLMGAAGEGNIIMILALILVTLAVSALIYFGLSKTFITISTIKSGTVRVKYKKKSEKVNSQFRALVNREFKAFISSAIYVMNAGLGVIFSVILAVVLFIKAPMLIEIFTGLGELQFIFGVLLVFAGMELASLTTISAASVSIEGKKIYLSQSMPIKPSTILFAKVVNHFTICEAGVIAIGISAAIMLPGNIIMKIMYIVMPTVMNLFSALFGVVINLAFPKLDWVSEAVAVKQGMSVLLAMLVTSATSVAYLILCILTASIMLVEVFTLIFAAILVLASYFMYRHLNGKGAEIYQKLGQN